jgi:CCR4-NOT transcription complex subunit 4
MASDNEDFDSSDDGFEETTCPLCVEEMDLSDKNFLPCPCGYRVCMWCWHHIRENLNGLCPACRTPYKEDPHAFSAVNTEE